MRAISCWPQAASHLTSHPEISHLTFIGSRPVAHEVAKSASKTLIPLCVELGGKDAAIVLDHPDGRQETQNELNRIASIIIRGVFQSAGQNCIGLERIIAMPQAYSRLVSMLESRIKILRLGFDLSNPESGDVDVGAMISSASFSRLETLIAEAVAQGARLLVGGHRHKHPEYPQGSYFEPTLLVDVTPEMRIAQEELFAPVCVVMKASSIGNAVTIANSTSYGLGSSVFGPSGSRAAGKQLEYVTQNLKTGMVAVNDFAVFYAVQLPFGGARGSGYGRFAGKEGLRGLCNAKSVCVDRWPGLIKTMIPGKLDYPMGKGAYGMGRGVIELGYGENWNRRVQGISKTLGM